MGVAAGVLVGGALTTWAGWQTIFWINGPIGAVALVAAIKVVPKADAAHRSEAVRPARRGHRPRRSRRFDLSLGATEQHGWLSARTLALLGVSAILLTAFALIERRAVRPLVPPHTWKVKSLVTGTVVMLGITGILVGAVFLTSIYLQNVLGYTALRAGLAFLPFALAITAGAQVARHLPARPQHAPSRQPGCH